MQIELSDAEGELLLECVNHYLDECEQQAVRACDLSGSTCGWGQLERRVARLRELLLVAKEVEA